MLSNCCRQNIRKANELSKKLGTLARPKEIGNASVYRWLSQGAIMSCSTGLLSPKEVKGIIALSGRLLVEVRPFTKRNEELQRLKVFVVHGVQDNTLQIQYARDAKLFIEDLKVPLSYHEYQMGHQSNGDVLNDLNEWMANF